MSFDSDHLSQIETLWSLVRAAGDDRAAQSAAREALVRRYEGAVRAFLRTVARDVELAEELYQEFALRLVRGDFENAAPCRGRFRDYLKTSLRHMVTDHRRRVGRRPVSEALSDVAEPAAAGDDEEFDAAWRDELLARAWRQLEAREKAVGEPWFTTLRIRVKQPKLSSSELAEEVGRQCGRARSDAAIRKVLERSRKLFSDLLLAEVAEGLESPSRETVEQELIDVGLYDWCRAALDRRYLDGHGS